MSNPTSSQVLHPENPTMGKETSTPKESGQTRVLPDGSLLYHDPLTKTEVPAVRLSDIRPKLVQEASSKLSYRFPKKRGFEDTNVTAFVKKDYNFGPNRENRPDRLFQIESDGTKGEKPNGYVMYEGRIVLDAFDHGLRNFGTQLPMYVSSELEGHDIEDYLRRNWEITLYDLVARAPNGYWTGDPEERNKKGEKVKANKWHDGPPRVGTFSMRATRFRTDAGCLSWGKKEGTAPKNKRILDLIPAQYKDPAVNSTKGWRDLSPAEIKVIKDGAVKTPQKARKKNRAAKAEKELLAKDSTMENSVEGEHYLKEGETNLYGYEDAWAGQPDEQDAEELPEYESDDFEPPMSAPQVYRMSTQVNNDRQTLSVVGEDPEDFENEPSLFTSTQPHKSSGDTLIAASSSFLAQSRVNFATNTQPLETEAATSDIPKSRMARKQLDQSAQHGIHDSVPPIQFTSMNQRYDIPPFRVQRKKPTRSKKASFSTRRLGFPAKYWQTDAQNTAFPQTMRDPPETLYQDLVHYADDEEDCKEEGNTFEQPGQFLPVNQHQWDPERVGSPIYWP